MAHIFRSTINSHPTIFQGKRMWCDFLRMKIHQAVGSSGANIALACVLHTRSPRPTTIIVAGAFRPPGRDLRDMKSFGRFEVNRQVMKEDEFEY